MAAGLYLAESGLAATAAGLTERRGPYQSSGVFAFSCGPPGVGRDTSCLKPILPSQPMAIPASATAQMTATLFNGYLRLLCDGSLDKHRGFRGTLALASTRRRY